MGTEVLRPQDFWNDGFRLPHHTPAFHCRRCHYPNNTNPRHHRRQPSLPPPPRFERPDQRRKSPSPSPPLTPTPQPQQRELVIPSPATIPRRSSSADELHHAYYYDNNKTGMGHAQMGQGQGQGRIRIMRRRVQSLDTIDATRMKRDMNRGGRLMNKKYLEEDDVYAGSAFFSSPSPSSLPLPSFFNNNNNNNNNNSRSNSNKQVKKANQFHDSVATRDLRRLLRLE